ncbi:MAG TPA: glycine zipper domain-containing protein [Candidatus Binatus sp.]|nr:glycine zipper domain-containing protein [Candidatus Binatus sp.]
MKIYRKFAGLVGAIALTGALSACATPHENGALIGTGVGAVGGAAVGSAVGHPLAGAAIGGVAGGVTGYEIGKHQERERYYGDD